MGDIAFAKLPIGARVLKIEEQCDSVNEASALYVWALVDDTITETEFRKFRIAGTGHDILLEGKLKELELIFLDTIITSRDKFVWHIFEIVPESDNTLQFPD